MLRHTVSFGFTQVYNIEVSNMSAEQAEDFVRDKFKEQGIKGMLYELDATACPMINDQDVCIQVEETEELPDAPQIDAVRIYRADCIECNKCDNAEEGSAPWGNFTWHDHKWLDSDGNEEYGYFTCNECGTSLVTESEIAEYRDEA